MKRVMGLLGFLIFFPGGIAFAQELGNSAKLIPGKQFDVGVQGTWVFKQTFDDYDLESKSSDGSVDTARRSAKFENDRFLLATITYGLIDRLNLFVKLGLVDGGEFKESSPRGEWKASMESNFVWAVGAKGMVFEMQNGIGFVVGAQYLRYDNRELNNWTFLPTGATPEGEGSTTDDQIDYWQVDAVATVNYTIDRFTPYVGAGYSYSDVKEKGRWTHPDGSWDDYDASFNNENKVSVLVGTDVDLGKSFKVNLQGTFISRTALTLGISYAF